jgi:polyisoprenoid-binding protein YceI
MKNKLAKATITLGSLLTFSFGAIASESYNIDAYHSSILFKVNHLGASNFYGRFNDVSGEVTFDDKNPEKSSVNITVNANSVDTNSKKRDDHLRSPDFFNSKQFPTITFKSKKVEKVNDKTFKVTGDLSLHGVTKTISFTFNKVGEGKNPKGQKIMGGETSFTIKRSDFGMDYMQGPGMLGDDITLILSFEGVIKK